MWRAYDQAIDPKPTNQSINQSIETGVGIIGASINQLNATVQNHV